MSQWSERILSHFTADLTRLWVACDPDDVLLDEKLLTETVDVHAVTGAEESVKWFEVSLTTASTQGERIFTELLNEHHARLKEERERALYAFEARGQAIGRIGLPAVREHRRKRLQQEHDARMAALADMEASVPDLNPLMMVRVSGDVMPGGQVR